MGFGGSKPSPSSLRDATSPERGRFYAANRQMQKAPPSGELSSVCETERASPYKQNHRSIRRRSGGLTITI